MMLPEGCYTPRGPVTRSETCSVFSSCGEAPEKQHCSKEPSGRPDQTLSSISSRTGHLFLIHALARVVSRPDTTAQATAAIPTAHTTLGAFLAIRSLELARRLYSDKYARALGSPSDGSNSRNLTHEQSITRQIVKKSQNQSNR